MIQMIIEFEGICPSKKNSKIAVCRWRRPVLLPSKAYSKWHKENMETLKDLDACPQWQLEISHYFYIPYNKDWSVSKRPFDYTNKMESINDILVDAWIITDDNYTVLKKGDYDWEFVPFWEWKIVVTINPIW